MVAEARRDLDVSVEMDELRRSAGHVDGLLDP
jgi:hypothetical protein